MEQKLIPILFSTPMVQAILDGRKTMTRRIVKFPVEVKQTLQDLPDCALELTRMQDGYKDGIRPVFLLDDDPNAFSVPNRYGNPGDILWVRETLYQNGEIGLMYSADTEHIDEDIIPEDFNVRIDKSGNYKFCSIPSIYMEKWACRLFMKVTHVRVERLQDITEEDAIAEGVICYEDCGDFKNYLYNDIYGDDMGVLTAKDSFETLWQSINGKESWDDNPWVWVIEFERVERPDNFLS